MWLQTLIHKILEKGTTVSDITASETTPAAEVQNGVRDFEAALAFVEDGVSKLGQAAKAELVELAKKYL